MKRERIEIKSHYDLLSIMEDMFNEFLESLITKDWAIREVDEDYDMFQDELQYQFYYTSLGQDMAERYLKRMESVFNKYFPDQHFSIYTALYQVN